MQRAQEVDARSVHNFAGRARVVCGASRETAARGTVVHCTAQYQRCSKFDDRIIGPRGASRYRAVLRRPKGYSEVQYCTALYPWSCTMRRAITGQKPAGVACARRSALGAPNAASRSLSLNATLSLRPRRRATARSARPAEAVQRPSPPTPLPPPSAAAPPPDHCNPHPAAARSIQAKPSQATPSQVNHSGIFTHRQPRQSSYPTPSRPIHPTLHNSRRASRPSSTVHAVHCTPLHTVAIIPLSRTPPPPRSPVLDPFSMQYPHGTAPPRPPTPRVHASQSASLACPLPRAPRRALAVPSPPASPRVRPNHKALSPRDTVAVQLFRPRPNLFTSPVFLRR